MTLNWYNQHANSWIFQNERLKLYDEFLEHLPPGAHILDGGCGSGKHARAFLDLGYQVTAFDGSCELAQIASEKIGQPVETLTFAEYQPSVEYDAIWTNASLLHVPKAEIEGVMRKLLASLKEEGIWHMTFKYGEGEREKEGRFFNDYTPEGLGILLEKFPVTILLLVKEDDLRPGREGEFWTRALIKK